MPDTNSLGFQIPGAHDITQQIDNQLSGPIGYQFPADTPKYHTIIKLTEYNVLSDTGPAGAAGVSTAVNAFLSQAGITATPGGVASQARRTLVESLTAWFNNVRNRYNLRPAARATTSNIILPLPVDLIDTHQVKYDEKPILPWDQLLGGAAGALGAIVGGAAGLPAAAVASAGYLAGDAVAQVGFGLIGLAPNDFNTILFDRPMYKRFQLKFKLAPRTFTESEGIKNIIWVFNTAMSPGLTGGGALFTFPNLFHITLRPNDSWLYRFKPAVLEAFHINYANGGNKAFYRAQGAPGDSPPESVELTMHFIEVEYWLRGDFLKVNT